MRRAKRRAKRRLNRKRVGATIALALTIGACCITHPNAITWGEWYYKPITKEMIQGTETQVQSEQIEIITEHEEVIEKDIAKTSEVAILDTEIVKATNVSTECINLIKKYEGCKLEAYKLHGESNYTIGYGTSNRSIRKGQRITEKQAEKMLEQEVQSIVDYVLSKDLELTQNELNALVSFTYNCGKGNLNRLVNGRNKEEIAEHITAYTKSSSETNRKGLLKRRLEEKEMFLGGK